MHVDNNDITFCVGMLCMLGSGQLIRKHSDLAGEVRRETDSERVIWKEQL